MCGQQEIKTYPLYGEWGTKVLSPMEPESPGGTGISSIQAGTQSEYRHPATQAENSGVQTLPTSYLFTYGFCTRHTCYGYTGPRASDHAHS